MTVLSSSRQGSGRSGQIPNLRIRWDGDVGSEITPRDGGEGWDGARDERGGGGGEWYDLPPLCPLTVHPTSQHSKGQRTPRFILQPLLAAGANGY